MSQLKELTVGESAAAWRLRFPKTAAVGLALVPVVFTGAASALAQVMHAGEVASALIIAIGAGISAVLGVVVMRISPSTVRQYGLTSPRRARAALLFVPLVLTVAMATATQGIAVPSAAILAYAVLAAVVAVNEEVWFRGIVLAVLRSTGVRSAIIGSSIIFGALHLANLAGGQDPAATALQLVFAVLFGVVAAEITVLTGSLWPAILWHAAWDFVNDLSGNAATTTALIGIGAVCAIMLAYAVVLWRPALEQRD
jgi:membrane protease YdiL (CAAX protease family)